MSDVDTPAVHIPDEARDVPDNWTWHRLEDVCENIFDCPHSTPKKSDVGPLMARTQDVMTGVFRADQAQRVSEETYTERIKRAEPSVGDLMYSREGTYFGVAAEVPPNTRVCLGQRMVLIRANSEILDFRYLRHWLNSPVMASHIHGYRDGSVAERLNVSTIRGLPTLIPPLAEQRAIASILGALDDKIELNRRMNATLESLARAIFKSWFVDFDPVHANAIRQNAGKTGAGQMPTSSAIPSTHDPKVLDLFPSTFQDSELGPIPQGWEPIRLESILELAYGKALKKSDRIAGEFPVYGSGGLTGSHNESLVDGPGVIVGRKGSVGTLYWEDSAFYPIDTVFYVKPRNGRSLQYIFYLLQTLGLEGMNTDAAVPGLNRNNAYRLEIPNASQDAMDEFTKVATAIRNQIAGNDAEINQLASARDALLPQLLSGELTVPDALTRADEALIGGSK